MTISTQKLRQAFVRLMAQQGRPIERIARPADRRGPTVEAYTMSSGQTVRLRTNNKPAVMVVAASGAADARLPFEDEGYLGIVFPAERPGFVVGYLVPSNVARDVFRETHARWLASNVDRSRDNRTRVLHFDGDPAALGEGYASHWSEYRLGEIALDATTSKSNDVVEQARRMIAAEYRVPISAVRISVDLVAPTEVSPL